MNRAVPRSAILPAGAVDDTADRPIDLRLARGIGTSAITLAAYSLRPLYGVLVASLLGGNVFGVYVLAFAWTDLLSQIGGIGLDSSALTFAARAAGRGQPALSRLILERAVKVGAASSTLVALLLLLALSLGVAATPAGLAPSLAMLAVAIPALTISRISSTVARGLGVMHIDFYATGIVGTLLLPVGLLLALALGFGPLSAAIGAAGSTVGAAVVAWIMARRIVRRQGLTRTDDAHHDLVSGLVKFTRPIAVTSVLKLAVQRFDVLLLGAYVGSAPGVTPLTLGAYAAAAEIAGGLRKLRQLFTFAFAPIAASATSPEDMKTLSHDIGQLGRWILLLACPGVCLAALGGNLVLQLYSREFTIANSWLTILAAATAAHGFLGIFETVLLAHRPSLGLINALAALVVQAGVSIWLIPRYGPVGAAVGIACAYAVHALVQPVEVRTLTGLKIPWHAMRRPVQASMLALVPAVMVKAAAPLSVAAPAAAAVFVAGYVGCLMVCGLEREDTALVDALRGRRAHLGRQ